MCIYSALYTVYTIYIVPQWRKLACANVASLKHIVIFTSKIFYKYLDSLEDVVTTNVLLFVGSNRKKEVMGSYLLI